MPDHSRLIKMQIRNLGCIGSDGLTVELDNIICLVGANNTGKSTVLRAYEAAVGNLPLTRDEIPAAAAGQSTSVEIWVHIPIGTANIDERWKEVQGNLRLVRSKWEWDESLKPKRYTWDPVAQDYAVDGKAAGLDTVFASRLPQPFRVSAMATPKEEHDKLLELVLDPIADELLTILADENSALKTALKQVREKAQEPVQKYAEKIGAIKAKVNKAYQGIFPRCELDLVIGFAEFDLKAKDHLVKGSKLNVKELGETTGWHQQGTGSQRCLFWSMLEVRSELKRIRDAGLQKQKQLSDLEKELKKKSGEHAKAKKSETQQAKQVEIDSLRQRIEELKSGPAHDPGDDGLALPGHMLLIDEPEIALHPNAVRAAKNHLYDLARESGWQVMLTTHSPVFVDPLEDHTTIIRLHRTKDSPAPTTYRSDEITFSPEDKENLKMLLQFDTAIAEMFFGAHPIVVEGDTEFAAFLKTMELDPGSYPHENRPLVIRARGKAIIPTIIRMLTHFKVPFSVLHDSDQPKRSDGGKNSAYTMNVQIKEHVDAARQAGLRVVHRVSIPDFERQHKLQRVSKDKPFTIWKAVPNDVAVAESVRAVLDALCSTESQTHPFAGEFLEGLREQVLAWARIHAPEDKQFSFA